MSHFVLVALTLLSLAACAEPLQPVGPNESLAEKAGPQIPSTVTDGTGWVPHGFTLPLD